MSEHPKVRRRKSHLPLRVAYVVHTFAIGGLERCIARLVNQLDPALVEPVIICLNHSGDAAHWIARSDVPVIELGKRPGNDPKMVWRFGKALRKHRVDIVHSHNWPTLVETVVARRLAGVPIHIHAEHGLTFDDRPTSPWRQTLRWRAAGWALRRADAVVAIAQAVRERLVSKAGLDANAIHFIPNGVDAQEVCGESGGQDPIRASLGIAAGAFVVGSVGRLAPIKDFCSAIEAIGLLVQRGMDVHLALVGDGPSRDSLAGVAAARGITGRVHLVGQQVQVAPWLAAMDVYVNSSVSEAMNLGILEAMSAGVPCVVTNVGDNALLVSGDDGCGLVVPPASPALLADALATMLADASSRRRFACCARQRFARQYSTAVMTSRYEELYASMFNVEIADSQRVA